MKFHFLFINLIIPHQMLEKVCESLGLSFYLKGQMESGVSINVMIVRCEFNCPCPVERIFNWSFITKVWSLPHRFVDICYASIKKLLIFLAWKRSKTFSKDCQADQAIKNVLMTLYVTLLPCIYVLSFIFNIQPAYMFRKLCLLRSAYSLHTTLCVVCKPCTPPQHTHTHTHTVVKARQSSCFGDTDFFSPKCTLDIFVTGLG